MKEREKKTYIERDRERERERDREREKCEIIGLYNIQSFKKCLIIV